MTIGGEYRAISTATKAKLRRNDKSRRLVAGGSILSKGCTWQDQGVSRGQSAPLWARGEAKMEVLHGERITFGEIT